MILCPHTKKSEKLPYTNSNDKSQNTCDKENYNIFLMTQTWNMIINEKKYAVDCFGNKRQGGWKDTSPEALPHSCLFCQASNQQHLYIM